MKCWRKMLSCAIQFSWWKILKSTPEQSVILKEHMRRHEQLVIMSHRFQLFLLSSLLTVTLSQFTSLFVITVHSGIVSFAKVGDLAVCSATQLIGLVFCLHWATNISHTVQRIVSFVCNWHVVASSIEPPSDATNNHMEQVLSNHNLPLPHVESNED